MELISFYIYYYLYALEEILYVEIECHGLLLFIFSQLFLDDRDSLTVMVGVFEQRLQIDPEGGGQDKLLPSSFLEKEEKVTLLDILLCYFLAFTP